ncbi:MAG: phage baseplate assembly protein V, partial [Deltaproteobacteria bacterium]|nr:phage baseplate assembly protein V [Deltaproteobacteria bacterium]
RLEIPWRPRRATPVPRISGQVTAWIDGSGTGHTPETDGWGRYKILFPLDVSGRGDGKASSWIRMAQPYVGMGYGQHFPLTPGTEVLISFVDGNPDRPVITGAVPNAETGNLVNASNPNQAVIGSKGGGSLVFGNDPEKQNVTLSAGSDRGHLTIASGSPTTAAMYADVTSTTSTVNSTTNVFMSNNTAGYRYEIGAGDTKMRNVVLWMAAVREAVETAASASQVAADYDGKPATNEMDSAAILCNNIGNIVDFAINPLAPLIGLYYANKGLPEPDLRLPDPNLLAIVGDDSGSKTTWNSKTPYGANTWNSWLTAFLLIMKPLRDAMNSADTIATFNANMEKDEFKEQPEAHKKAAKGVAWTTETSKIACDLLGMGVLLKTLWGASGNLTAKGILVHNKDSYVDVLAQTWAGMSAKGGPLVLESSAQQAADDLRCSAPMGLTSLPFCLAGESTGEPSAEPLKENAVLLHGKLIRTFCNELSLSAMDTVGVKSTGKVRILQAASAPPPIPASGLEALQSRNVIIKDPHDFRRGIDITSLDPGAAIRIQTTQTSSPVRIFCGSDDGDDQCRKLTFDVNGTTLQQDQNASLVMNQQGVTLKADPAKKLSMETTGEVSLTQSLTNGLAFNDDNALLAHVQATSISGAGGESLLKLDVSGCSMTAKAIAQVKAQLVDLG